MDITPIATLYDSIRNAVEEHLDHKYRVFRSLRVEYVVPQMRLTPKPFLWGM